MKNSINVAVIGASGYAGAELTALLCGHDSVVIKALLVSEQSTSCGKTFSELHARWLGICDVPLLSFSEQWLKESLAELALDAVFFATPHEYSVQWAHEFLSRGIHVFDLSGGFRLSDQQQYPKHYGFEHQYPALLTEAQYGLAEFYADQIKTARLVAVPGCYPTASLIALKPLCDAGIIDEKQIISVNGISGVSGAGRKASLATSFCEVSLSPYNILQHRHQPEISQYSGQPVIFNPHLAPFKRGLLSTVTAALKQGITTEQVNTVYQQQYQDKPLVRLTENWPKVDHVAYTAFADLHWQVDEEQGVVVASCAIDNLLKGAAAQAVQCLNIQLDLPSHYSLLPSQCTNTNTI